MAKHRHIYLKMKTLQEARDILFENFQFFNSLPSETVPVPDGVDRVLAKTVAARLSSPHFHSSAMDGIAVKAASTFGASETRPKELVIGKDAFYINTGHVLPKNTDAVIMIEHVNVLGQSRVEIEAPTFPWQNVRKVGEDIVATELLFPQNHTVTPYCVGALLSGGVFRVSVRKKPKILIIPTGSELVDWRDLDIRHLKPGQVIESNSSVLGKLVESCGGIFVRNETLADDLSDIKQTVAEAVTSDFDMVLMIGGSSAGSEDYSKDVIIDLGDVLVHGVTIMPGKPVIIGKIKEKPVFGIPYEW